MWTCWEVPYLRGAWQAGAGRAEHDGVSGLSFAGYSGEGERWERERIEMRLDRRVRGEETHNGGACSFAERECGGYVSCSCELRGIYLCTWYDYVP